MTILFDNINSAAKMQDAVLAIGNFDGMHRGHRHLIGEAAALARQAKAPLGVMTFEPHPRQFFQPDAEPFRLTPLSVKQRMAEDMGVDYLFALPFNQQLSQLDGNAFIDRILVQAFKARHIVVGTDFAFGHKRSGTTETLKTAAAAGKFKLTIVPPATTTDEKIYSSTAIRDLLKQGDFAAAEKFLGWRWYIEAPVVHGDKRGRTLGYPTANQEMTDYLRIPFGIYAVRAQIGGEKTWRTGVANFGIRPMFRAPHPLFETFIFDFDADIYGKTLCIMPVQRLRAEQSFSGIPALMAQMKEDCIAAMAVLKSFHAGQ